MTQAFKRGLEFPHEGFVQASLETHFEARGYQTDSTGRVDLSCRRAMGQRPWHIEAKGVTTQVGLDFRTGVGQLLQAMRDDNTRYGLAMPDTAAFRAQVAKFNQSIVDRLGIHWIFVGPGGDVEVLTPRPYYAAGLEAQEDVS